MSDWLRHTRTPGERAYAVWYRHTYPTAPSPALYAWQLLATYDEGRAVQAMWHAIAQAVLSGHREDTHA